MDHQDLVATHAQDGLDPALLAELMTRIAVRDEAAFERLYTLLAPRLLSLAIRLTRRRDQAEDLLQDLFATVWLKASHYDADRGRVLSWTITILHNRFRDRLRVRTAPQVPIEDVFDLETDLPSPLADAQASEDARRLHAVLDELPERMRKAVLMAYFEDADYPEIAIRSGAPVNTVKSWVRRALQRMRGAMAE